MNWKRWIDAVMLSGNDPVKTDPGVIRQIRNVNIGHLGVIFISGFNAVSYALLGSAFVAGTAGLASAAGVLSMLWLRRSRNVMTAGNMLTAICGVVFTATVLATGTVNSPAFAWFGILPLIAGVLASYRSSLIWGGVAVVLIAFFYSIERAGAMPPPLIAEDQIVPLAVFETTMLLAAVTVGVVTFTLYQEWAKDRLWQTIQWLRTEVQARRRAELEAVEASRVKSEFLANMSHEIRTPMNGVLGAAQLLQMGDLTPEQQEYVEILTTTAQTLNTLIDDIFDFSRIDAGQLDLELAPFDLRGEIEQIARTYRGRADAKGLDFQVVLPDDLPAWCIGDRRRIAQVLSNLADNAVKFTLEGYVQLWVAAERKDSGMLAVEIAVADSGIGISDIDQEALFNPFTQGDASSTKRYGGAGLGLVIAQQLVELMDGEIGVESVQGEGSTFTVRLLLPYADSDEAPRPARTAERTATSPVRAADG